MKRLAATRLFAALLAACLLLPATSARAAGCGTTGAPTMTVYLPNVTKTLGGPNGWNTPFIVQNIGTVPTTVEASFYRFSDGALVACRRLGILATANQIRPHAAFFDIPNNDPELPDDSQFSVVIQSFGAPVVAVVNEHITSPGPAAAAYSGVSSGATTVSLPNVTRRYYGYDTPIIVQNLGSATATMTARFVSFDGTRTFALQRTIAPSRSTVIDPDFTQGLVDGTQYAATLTADQPIAAVVNTNSFVGSPVAASYNGLTTGASRVWAPYVTVNRPAPDGASPVIIQNLGTTPTVPGVAVYLNVPGSTAPNCLVGVCTFTFDGPETAPGTSWVFDPRLFACSADGPPNPCLPDGTIGGLSVEAQTVTGTGANAGARSFDPTGRLAAIVTPNSSTTAMAYRAMPASTVAYLPNVTRNLGGDQGWTTPIRLIGAGQVTVSWYRLSDGALVLTQSFGVGSYCCGEAGTFRTAAKTIDPRDALSPEQAGGEPIYSVVIQDASTTPTPFAVMVTELAPGGDNAMAYEGFTGP